MSESIVIANSTIRQQDGLYCLNDLHRASGGKAFMQVLVTPLGMMKLAQKLEIAV